MKILNTININSFRTRIELWKYLIDKSEAKKIAEIGVYKGAFAEEILRECSKINQYYLIDPWRNLENWNKPANKTDDVFETYYQEALRKTSFAAEKRIILRGKTTEVIDEIPSQTLDFAYIDGDHTLKGITIDLITIWDKVSENGILAGDDFSPSIWQHDLRYEPTLIFPFAVYFAEAMDVKIYGLPFNQFLIAKSEKGFEFIDMTPKKSYRHIELKSQFKPGVKENLKTLFNRLYFWRKKY